MNSVLFYSIFIALCRFINPVLQNIHNLSDHTINEAVAQHETAQNTKGWIIPTFRNIKTLVRKAIIFRDCFMYHAIQPIGILFNHLSCHIKKSQKVLSKTTSNYRFPVALSKFPHIFHMDNNVHTYNRKLRLDS